MNYANLQREIARATGESVDRIQRIGFRLVVTPTRNRHPVTRKRPSMPGKPEAPSVPSSR